MQELPMCPSCYNKSDHPQDHWRMVPLSDFGPDGASLYYKAWACTNSKCRHVLHIQKGIVHYNNQERT